jgi:small acid-soluble spore protein H (minor)
MDTQRAKEILAARNMINVTFNGTPIYIERVNDTRSTASVHPLNQPQNIQEVPVTSLEEH